MSDLTKRQWKALLVAYPLYGAPSEPHTADTPSQLTPATAGDEGRETAMTTFLSEGVPKMRKAFADVLSYDPGDRATRTFSVPPPLTPPRPSGQPHWRESVPRDVDALLAYLFLCPSRADTDDAVSKDRRDETEGPHPFGPHCAPLTAVEKQLLGLWSRERQRAESYYAAQQKLEQQVRSVAQALLQSVSDSSTAATTTTAMMAATTAVSAPGHVTYSCARALASADSLQDSPHQEVGTYRSQLASMPLTGQALADMWSLQQAIEAQAASSSSCATNVQAVVGGGRPGIHPVVCAGCGLADGELFTCGQCGSVRHEACGGPHPTDAPSSGADADTLALCRACRRGLCVGSGSSSSSLRSSTSTDEREALDREFGSDHEDSSDASSLSGFIVHTSDDDDDDDEEDGSDGETGEGASNSHSASEASVPRGRGAPAHSRRQRMQTAKAFKRPRSDSSDDSRSETSDDNAEKRASSSSPGRGKKAQRRAPPRRARRTTEHDAHEELATLLGNEPRKVAKAADSARPARPSKGRRSELIVDSSGSSSQMSDLDSSS